jgi:hypothetical protein
MTVNVDVSKLTPGVFGVSHGSGAAGEIIRTATQSSAGHAFLYLGNGQIVSGQPTRAVVEPADSYSDAIWAWRMWDQLKAAGWTAAMVLAAQAKVVARGRALIGTDYDWPAYAAFAAEVLHLRSTGQLAGYFAADRARVCSALVDDAETAGGVPMVYVPEDGPGLIGAAGRAAVPANLVAPGMLLGLAQRSEWV